MRIERISCEDRKLAGHLVDLGAVAYTKEEGALWADGTLDDLALARLEETAEDTKETRDLRKRRAAATEGVDETLAAELAFALTNLTGS